MLYRRNNETETQAGHGVDLVSSFADGQKTPHPSGRLPDRIRWRSQTSQGSGQGSGSHQSLEASGHGAVCSTAKADGSGTVSRAEDLSSGRDLWARHRVIELNLPWPPSTNTYWRHPTRGPLAGRHLISEKGRAYRTDVLAHVLQARAAKNLSGSLSVSIEAYPPDRRKRDLDNLLKSLLDSLTHAGVILDDSCIDKLSIERGPVTAPGSVSVVITHKE